MAQALNCTGVEAPCGACSQCKKTVEFNHPDLHYVFPVPHPSSESDKKKLAEEIAELLRAGSPPNRGAAVRRRGLRIRQGRRQAGRWVGRGRVITMGC